MVISFKDSEIVKNTSIPNKDKDKLLVYLELTYSKKSEFSKILDLDERKKQAFAKAKLKYDKDVAEMKCEEMNWLIFNYLTYFQGDNGFSLLMANQQLFWNLTKEMMLPDDYEEKLKMSEKCDALYERIKTRFNEIYDPGYNGDKVAEIAKENIRLMRPESRIKKASV